MRSLLRTASWAMAAGTAVFALASCQPSPVGAIISSDETFYTIRGSSVANVNCTPSQEVAWIGPALLEFKEYNLGVGYRRTYREDYTQLESNDVWGGAWGADAGAYNWGPIDWRKLGRVEVFGDTAVLTLSPDSADVRLEDLSLRGEFPSGQFQSFVNSMQRWPWQWGTMRESLDTIPVDWQLTGNVDGTPFTLQCTQAFKVLRVDTDMTF